MPDDDKTPEEKAPAFNAEEVASKAAKAAAEQVAATLAQRDAADREQAALAEGERQRRAAEAVQPQDALEQVLEPYVTKRTSRAELIAMLAADKADFYTVDDPDELSDRIGLKAEIEKRADALARGGRPIARKDIYDHLRGGEKFEEFAEKRATRKAKRDQMARDAQDHAADGVPHGKSDGGPSYVDENAAYDMQDKGKLEGFLGDKRF